MRRIESYWKQRLRHPVRVVVYLVVGWLALTGMLVSNDMVNPENSILYLCAGIGQGLVANAEAATPDSQSVPHSFADLAEKSSLAVVNIRTVKTIKRSGEKIVHSARIPLARITR